MLVRLNSVRCQDLMDRRGLTLTVLAARAGVSYQTARRGVAGAQISVGSAQRLCNILKVHFHELCHDIGGVKVSAGTAD